MKHYFGFRSLGSFGSFITLLLACGGKSADEGSSVLGGAPDAGDAGGSSDASVHLQGDAIQRKCLFEMTCPYPGFSWTQGYRWNDLAECLGDERFRASVSDLSTDRWSACAATATTCAEWTDCLTLRHGDYCSTHPGESCVDNIAFHCFEEAVGRWPPEDCGVAPGTKCEIVNNHDNGLPGLAFCTTGETCSDAFATRACVGKRGALVCDAGSERVGYVDCNEFHYGQFDALPGTETCTDAQGCAPPGPTCTTEGVTCDGSIATDCRFARDGAPIIAVTIDCAASGQRCQPRGPGRTSACVPVAIECDPATFVPSCAGTTLELCVLGKLEHVDCAAYGGAKCSASPVASCNP